MELTVGEKYRQRNPRKPAAGSHVNHPRTRRETDHLRDPQRMQHVPLVQVLHVLPRHHIDLRVPLPVQLLQGREAVTLLLRQFGEIAFEEKQGTRDEGRGTRDEGRGTRDEGRGTWDVGRGTWDEVRGTRCEAGVTSIQLLVTSY